MGYINKTYIGSFLVVGNIKDKSRDRLGLYDPENQWYEFMSIALEDECFYALIPNTTQDGVIITTPECYSTIEEISEWDIEHAKTRFYNFHTNYCNYLRSQGFDVQFQTGCIFYTM